MRISAGFDCAAGSQCIVAFTLRPSGALPPRVAGSYVQRSSTTSPAAFISAPNLHAYVHAMLRQWLDENMARVLTAALKDELKNNPARLMGD